MKRTHELVEHFIVNYPEIYQSLHSCKHQKDIAHVNPFHKEGDVWTHTLLAMQVARRRYPGKILNKIAVLCHDFGKPIAREISDKGRVRFFGHESLSNFISTAFINDPILNLKHSEKIKIHEMINYHLKIWDLFEYTDAVQIKGKRTLGSQVRLSQKGQQFYELNPVAFKNVITLLECDEQGRIADDQRNRTFYRNLKLIHHNMDKLPVKHKVEGTAKITLLIGPPLSGKSSWVQKNLKDEIIISRDDTLMKYAIEKSGNKNISYTSAFKEYGSAKEVDREVQELYNKNIKRNKNIIVDMTNMSSKSRKKWLNVPKTYSKQAIVFMIDYEVLKNRNHIRSKTGKVIPSHVLVNMMKNFVIPNYNEFDKIDWIF